MAGRPLIPACPDIADASRDGDGPGQGGRRSHRFVDFHAAPAQKGHGQASSAESHQAGNSADGKTRKAQPSRARRVLPRSGIKVHKHLRGDDKQKTHEENLEPRAGHSRREKRTGQVPSAMAGAIPLT